MPTSLSLLPARKGGQARGGISEPQSSLCAGRKQARAAAGASFRSLEDSCADRASNCGGAASRARGCWCWCGCGCGCWYGDTGSLFRPRHVRRQFTCRMLRLGRRRGNAGQVGIQSSSDPEHNLFIVISNGVPACYALQWGCHTPSWLGVFSVFSDKIRQTSTKNQFFAWPSAAPELLHALVRDLALCAHGML